MSNWNLPTTASLYTDLVDNLKERDLDVATMFKTLPTNPVTDMVRWDALTNKFEIYNGASWVALSTAYEINVTSLNGQAASYYQDAGNLSAGTLLAARFNDTSHGARGGGTTHPAVVAAGASGFMTGADKTKLNGIETAAKDDQTAAEILALLLTVDIDLSGLNATTLQGLSPSSFNQIIGTDTDINTSGSTIVDSITVTDGVITAMGTRVLTIGDLGITATAAEVNYTTDVTSNIQAQLNGKLATGATAAASTLAAITNDTTTNATHYVEFASGTSGNLATKVSSTKLTFNPSTGFLIAGGDVTAYSDLKLKKDIVNIDDAINKVLTLNGCIYTRKDTKQRQTGLIAQEVQKILPEAVHSSDDGTLSLAYGNLAGLLVEAIKELNGKVELLKVS